MATKGGKKAKAEYRIEKKRSGRWVVRKRLGGYIRGPEKVALLVKEGILKFNPPKKKPEKAEATTGAAVPAAAAPASAAPADAPTEKPAE